MELLCLQIFAGSKIILRLLTHDGRAEAQRHVSCSLLNYHGQVSFALIETDPELEDETKDEPYRVWVGHYRGY